MNLLAKSKGLFITSAFYISLPLLTPCMAMEVLTDEFLSEARGQTLLSLSYIAPGEDGNPTTGVNANIGFYRIMLNADVELNMNVAKYYLGCSGDINSLSPATRDCDVDIDNVRFSGMESPQTSINRDTAPATDFLMKNPFLELAIRNPNVKALRELVGLRTGGEKARGIMSFGDRPYNGDGTPKAANDPTQHSGINRMSGFMDMWLGDGINQSVTALCPTTNCLTNPPAAGTGTGQGVGIQPIQMGGLWGAAAQPNAWGVIQAFPNGRPAITYTNSLCSLNVGFLGNSAGCATGRQDPALPVGANIFPKQYTARSNYIELGVVYTLTNIIPTILFSSTTNLSKARFAIDPRILHRIQVGDENTFSAFDTFLSKLGDRKLTTPSSNYSDPVDNKPLNPDTWLKWKNLNDGSWDPVPLGWSMGVGKVVNANFKGNTLPVSFFEGLQTLKSENGDLMQIPTDNCYGHKTFC